jgi:hypothetical protein
VESDITADYTQQLLLKSLTVICQSINDSLVRQQQKLKAAASLAIDKKKDDEDEMDVEEHVVESIGHVQTAPSSHEVNFGVGESVTTEQAVVELQVWLADWTARNVCLLMFLEKVQHRFSH